MALIGHHCVRLPSRFHRISSLYNSTVANTRSTVFPFRPQSPRSVCVPHFMGTWTDRIKRRWQSGNQTQDTSDTKETQHKTKPKPEECGDGETSPSDLQQTLKEKEELITANEEKIKDLQDKYLRALAEAENTRTRLTRQVEEAKRFGIQDFSKDVVEVADILDKAVDSVKPDDLKDNPSLATLFEGLKLTEAELHKVMSKNGLEKIEEDGVTFDPNIHEAMFEVPGGRHGNVAVVSRVGYILQGRTIRPARVGIFKAPDS